jgi:hypothetical protein
MQIEIFTCCERVQQRNGKRDIISATTSLSPLAGTKTLQTVVALRVRFQPEEIDVPHKLGLRMTDADCNVLFEKDGNEYNVPVLSEEDRLRIRGEDYLTIDGTFDLNGTQFAAYGDHFLTLLLDGSECITTRVFVRCSD